MRIPTVIKQNALYIVFAQALVALVGSLYLSNVLHIPPCNLCWYQRIAIYPIAFIAGVGIWRNDKTVYTYILPISLTGLAISIYHNLLYYGLIPELIRPCTNSVPCTARSLEVFGFITIPLMSLAALTIITVGAFLYRQAVQEREKS